MTSQQVVDFVRLQVSEGKELSEIGEMICDHCLSPSSDDYDHGSDNMTIIIVAILHGRTKEEWYAWVTDRVKNGYGYKTPSEAPRLYSRTYKEKLEAQEQAQQRYEEKKAGIKRDPPPPAVVSSIKVGGAIVPSLKVGDTIPSGTFSYIPYTPEFENNNVSLGPF
jgi:protein phosphatase 2C family protein 2/3